MRLLLRIANTFENIPRRGLKLRKVNVDTICEAIKELFINANYYLCTDIRKSLEKYRNIEISQIGKEILDKIIENADMAADNQVAICQDTGMSVVFLEVGQEVCFVGGNINEAINEGVRRAYKEGYLRKSVVADPIRRGNTGDNTPAIIYYDIVPGDKVRIQVMPKGFGSENMSRIKMLKPSDGVEGIIVFVLDTVVNAGSNPCPPIIVGVGIGGTFEKAALLSKRALLRSIEEENADEYYRELEKTLLGKINDLGIGPQGMGGITTALSVNIEAYPTHIAGLPVAVNITCHATRHMEMIM
jgi:fumarate hydratase subunit alpha